MTIERMSTQAAHNTTSESEEQQLGTVDVAKQLGVHKSTVRRWVQQGSIVPVLTTPGGHHRFDQASISDFKSAHRPSGPSPSVAN